MSHRVQGEIGGRTLTIETGVIARQAQGAVTVRYGDTVVLVTVCATKEPINRDFLPLTVEYREKSYAAGKIPGGYFKREGRPTEKEILSCRIIDRSIRPLFPKGYRHEIQLIATILSADQENYPNVLALIGASAALNISPIPFAKVIAGVRVGRIEGEYRINPTTPQLAESDVDMIIAMSRDSILMVEGGAKEVDEAGMVGGLKFGHAEGQTIIGMIEELKKMAGVEKWPYAAPEKNVELESAVTQIAMGRISEANRIVEKAARKSLYAAIETETSAALSERFPESEGAIHNAIHDASRGDMRKMVIATGKRIDGRNTDEIRKIECTVGVLPRTHGSAVFTRGETQSLTVVTLGTAIDEQRVDDLDGDYTKSYMLHYNVPPFSVGEVRAMRGTSRRETGHGALAERSIEPVIPPDDVFPYTVRIVSDILESNGSSSMATICAGSLALMDAGVPIKTAVAGIAMGLILEPTGVAVLSDILGDEDHLGDMDFKVAGTEQGITGFQMDIKIDGVTFEIMERALGQARAGRLHILGVMGRSLSRHREDLSTYAPRIIAIRIDPEKIREIIGPGGKMIRKITEESGAVIDVENDGTIRIASVGEESAKKALGMIKNLVTDPEIGTVYKGTVRRIVNFGAFVEILPGRDGLVHISELDDHRVAKVEDVLAEGDEIMVKIIGIDKEGKIRLSRKAAMAETAS
ncbi:MAG: polyribonucleotide nucleotidyltransferase [bacterium]